MTSGGHPGQSGQLPRKKFTVCLGNLFQCLAITLSPWNNCFLICHWHFSKCKTFLLSFHRAFPTRAWCNVLYNPVIVTWRQQSDSLLAFSSPGQARSIPLASPSHTTTLVALHQAHSKWLHIFLEHHMKGKFAPVPCEVPFPYASHITKTR